MERIFHKITKELNAAGLAGFIVTITLDKDEWFEMQTKLGALERGVIEEYKTPHGTVKIEMKR